MGRARYTLGREPKKACERKTRTRSDRIRVLTSLVPVASGYMFDWDLLYIFGPTPVGWLCLWD